MKSIREALDTIEHIIRVRNLETIGASQTANLADLQDAIIEHLGRIGRSFPEWLHTCEVTEALEKRAANRATREAGQVVIKHTEAAAYTSTDAQQK